MSSAMAYLIQCVLLYLIVVLLVSHVASQPTTGGVCEKDNMVCSLLGDTENIRLTQVKHQKEFEDVNSNDCADLYRQGHRIDGVYTIRLRQLSQPVQVYCDMTEDGGGWTRLLRRQDGSVNFTQTWDVYKKGFGNVSGEHWLGNDKMAALSRQRLYQLRIRLWDFDGETRYADYSSFVVDPEWDKYRLHIGRYSGDAGDSLTTFHNNQEFSTIDEDNDNHNTENCGKTYSAGFWFDDCYRAGITNVYSQSATLSRSWHGVVWYAWRGSHYSLKEVDMKIRPIDFLI